MNQTELSSGESIRGELKNALQAGWSLERISAMTDVAIGTLFNIYHGNVVNPRLHTIRKIQNFIETHVRSAAPADARQLAAPPPSDFEALGKVFGFAREDDYDEPFISAPPPCRGTYHEQQVFSPSSSGENNSLFERLEDWFGQTDRVHQVLLLRGVAGCGKTMSTWNWFFQACCADPAEMQPRNSGLFFYWRFDPRHDFAMFLNAALLFCTKGKIAGQQLSDDEKLQILYGLLMRKPYCLVLDDFHFELQAEHSWDQDQNILALDLPGRQCVRPRVSEFLETIVKIPLLAKIIITSRLRPAELDEKPNLTEHLLSGFSREEALCYLRHKLGFATGSLNLDSALASLADSVENHPHSLALLSDIIKNDPINNGRVRDLGVLAEYGAREQLLLDLPNGFGRLYCTLPLPVKTLCQRLTGFNADPTFSQIAQLHPPQDRALLKKWLGFLLEAGFVYPVDDDRFHLHKLLRLQAAAEMSQEEKKHAARAAREAQAHSEQPHGATGER